MDGGCNKDGFDQIGPRSDKIFFSSAQDWYIKFKRTAHTSSPLHWIFFLFLIAVSLPSFHPLSMLACLLFYSNFTVVQSAYRACSDP